MTIQHLRKRALLRSRAAVVWGGVAAAATVAQVGWIVVAKPLDLSAALVVTDLLLNQHALLKGRILDVGCGDGGYAKYCGQRGAHIILSDIDESRLQKVYSILKARYSAFSGGKLYHGHLHLHGRILHRGPVQ